MEKNQRVGKKKRPVERNASEPGNGVVEEPDSRRSGDESRAMQGRPASARSRSKTASEMARRLGLKIVNVPPMSSRHKGFVEEHFRPVHCEFTAHDYPSPSAKIPRVLVADRGVDSHTAFEREFKKEIEVVLKKLSSPRKRPRRTGDQGEPRNEWPRQ